jgi:XTP/dITP diphosphohydrolase
MQEIVFASTNKGKTAEVQRVAAGLGFSVLGLADRDAARANSSKPDVLETESTYEGNALRKARAYAQWLGAPCLVDDTGLEIAALGNLPGVFTANFGLARVKELLVSGLSYPARFVCCVVYAEPSGRSVSVTATLEGSISFPIGAGDDGSGVPFSKYFIPAGELQPVSELQSRIGFLSHRGRAITLLLSALGDSTIKGLCTQL